MSHKAVVKCRGSSRRCLFARCLLFRCVKITQHYRSNKFNWSQFSDVKKKKFLINKKKTSIQVFTNWKIYIAKDTTKSNCERQTFMNGKVNLFPASPFPWRSSLKCVAVKSKEIKRLKRLKIMKRSEGSNRRFRKIEPKKYLEYIYSFND